jgi:hypothetical protein
MLLDVGTAAYAPPPAIFEPANLEMSRIAPAVVENSDTTDARLVTPAPDPKKQYEAAYANKLIAVRRLYEEIQGRLLELVRDAWAEEEAFSKQSLSDFTSFIREVSFGRRPAIYLLDNGNLRAVWKNMENEQAAFQFRGGGIVDCVFFLKQKGPLPLQRETLSLTLKKARDRMVDFKHLLKG